MNKHTQKKREKILEQMRDIQRLRQGTISEQFYGKGENRQGPYYVLQGYTEGKHWSKRIPRDQLEQVQADLQAAGHFRELCKGFADLTEQATLAEDEPGRKKNAKKRAKPSTKN